MRHIVLLLLVFTATVQAQPPAALVPVQWTASVGTDANGGLLLNATATMEEGWHVYALTLPRDDGPFPTVFTFEPSSAYELKGGVVEEEPVEVEDPNFGMLVRYHGHKPVFVQKVERVSPAAFQVKGAVEYMACNDRMCLPPKTVPLVFQVDPVAK
ncbi:MAG: protein-disulfide reductase DsbD domain-containing protein [Flavobacteriales bacterium]